MIFFEFLFQASGGLGCHQVIDGIYCCGKQYRMALKTGLVSQSGGQVGFAKPHAAKQDHVAFFLDEIESEQVLDL